MRITTNAILRNYKNNLSNTISTLNTSRTHVMTNRSFNSAAENPASAARASQLHRKYYKNQDNLSMVKDVQSRLDSQESALMQVSNVAKTISKEYCLEAVNGTNQGLEDRQTYASALREYQKSMVLSLNSTYEDTFVFAGSDGKNNPFVLSDDGTLTYRGIDVDSAAGTPQYDQLTEYSKENLYVDLGMGLSMDEIDRVVPSSAFDMSLPGINAIGYGTDSDGVSKNAITLVGQMADLLEAEEFDEEAYSNLMLKFDDASSRIMDSITELGVKSEFLTTTKDRLENEEIAINEQMENVEGIDMAAAITDYMWNQYAYNAALKVGTSILSASFIDFMK